MKSSEYGIKIAKEKLSLAHEKSTYGYLKAPTDGIIALKVKNEGDYVSNKDVIFKFLTNENSKIKITIPQNYMDELKIDSEVATDNDKDEFLKILKTGNADNLKSKYAENYRFFQNKIKPQRKRR